MPWAARSVAMEDVEDDMTEESFQPTNTSPAVDGETLIERLKNMPLDQTHDKWPMTVRFRISETERDALVAALSRSEAPVAWREVEIVRLINLLRSKEGDSVEILCYNPDFNGQPNCAVVCCGDWTGWEDRRFAHDTVLDALSSAATEYNLSSPREIIAESNGHHWVQRFNLTCCRDCGIVRRADDQNSRCKGVVRVGLRASSPNTRVREALETVENLIRRDPACFNLSDELQGVRSVLRSLATLPQPGAVEPDDFEQLPYDDARFNKGVQHVVELFAKTLGIDDWEAGDGSENYNDDLQQTLLNIMEARNIYDPDTGLIGFATATKSPALDPATVEACAKKAQHFFDQTNAKHDEIAISRFAASQIATAIRALLASGASNAGTSTVPTGGEK